VYYRKKHGYLSLFTLDYLPASTAVYTITPITDLLMFAAPSALQTSKLVLISLILGALLAKLRLGLGIPASKHRSQYKSKRQS
jgi:hypothetical protein